MHKFLLLSLLSLPLMAQQINLTQIQGNGTPGSCSILFAAGGNARFLGQDNPNLCYQSSTHDLLVGGSTDGNFRLDLQSHGSAGMFRLFDQTGGGITSSLWRAGSGQGLNPLATFQTNGGTTTLQVGAAGDLAIFNNGALKIDVDNSAQFLISSDGSVGFTNGGSISTSILDTGISRISAGVLGIGNGAQGDFTGSLKLSGLILVGTTGCLQSSSGIVFGTGAPCGSGGGGGTPYTTTVTAQTSVSISTATHGQGTLATSFCFDNSNPRIAVACSYTRDAGGNMVFTFNPAFTGLIEVSGVSTATPYTTTVTSQTSVSISAATHAQGTLALSYCFSNGTPQTAVACSYTRDAGGNMVFTFNPAFTGLIEIQP